MGQRSPRLYRKASGIYWVRIVLPRPAPPSNGTAASPASVAVTSSSIICDHAAQSPIIDKPRNGQNRIEIRRSLSTTDFRIAHRISSVINALLAQAPTKDWKTIVNHLFSSKNISGWTAGPNGISVDGPDDQRRLQEFLSINIDIGKALAAALGSGNRCPSVAPVHLAVNTPSLPSPEFSIPAYTGSAGPAPMAGAKNPLRVSAALESFVERARESNKDRTAQDQVRAVRRFIVHLVGKKPELGTDPWVHDVGTQDISSFIDEQKNRTGKGFDEKQEPKTISASTLRKLILDIGVFFEYACNELKACHENPAAGLKKRVKQFGEVATVEKQSYLPFTDAHIKLIFEPTSYLASNRDPDYFWCPLLALFLGGRLGDYVRTRLSDIGLDSSGIRYIDVTEKVGKNRNSVRRLPIPSALIDLGFIEYVEHVRALGAKFLWPHRDLTSPTANRLPSKNQSNAFGNYMTKIGLTDPRLVFHSFRHTVVSALLDGGTPIHLSMQIIGHEAQDAAVKKGLMDESAKGSVHLGTYSNPDKQRMGTDRPLQSMKDALENCIQPPIDHRRLRQAARIVQDHIKKVGGEFRTGWPAQNVPYTDAQIAKLAKLTD